MTRSGQQQYGLSISRLGQILEIDQHIGQFLRSHLRPGDAAGGHGIVHLHLVIPHALDQDYG